MHEVQIKAEPVFAGKLVGLARESGIDSVTVMDAFEYGPDVPMKIVCACTSTPKARMFVDKILNEESLSGSQYSVTSRELRAIINGDGRCELTSPMSEPFPDIIQDLWQLSHITPSYVARAGAGAALLATGIIGDNPIAIVVAALFLPFLSEVMAVAFGIWSKDGGLSRHGLRAIAASVILGFIGGLAAGWLEGGPVRFSNFNGLWHNLIISAIIGATAGLSQADDTGRRYLIGVAAAVQLAIFPVWMGVVTATGLPENSVVIAHLVIFAVNLVTIAGTALAAFASLRVRAGGWKAPRSGKMEQGSPVQGRDGGSQ